MRSCLAHLTGAALAALLLVPAIGPAQAAPSAAGLRSTQRWPRPPFVSSRNRRLFIASGQTYTINDVGAPNPSRYPPYNPEYGPEGPQGFNNTGQMFGASYEKIKGYGGTNSPKTDCLLYDNGAFLDPSASTSIYSCDWYSMNDANTNGVFEAVGNITNNYNPDATAFVATGSIKSSSLPVTQFEAMNPSAALQSVNANGTGFGYTYDTFVPGSIASAVYSPTTKKFTALQPVCVAPGASQNGCLQYLDGLGPRYLCSFGGCSINATYLLGGTTNSSNFELYSLSGAPPVFIPSGFTDGNGNGNSLNAPLELTNYGLVAADFATLSGPNSGPYVAVFPAGGSAWQVLPSLSDGCPSHFLVSSNNSGEVLGFDSCSSSGPNTYWTWDPTNGIQAVNIPANSYSAVQLLGVNDNGQLLATLVTTSGSYHWGTFNPVGGSSSTRRLHAIKRGAIRIRH